LAKTDFGWRIALLGCFVILHFFPFQMINNSVT
jgi:hypothetical protein